MSNACETCFLCRARVHVKNKSKQNYRASPSIQKKYMNDMKTAIMKIAKEKRGIWRNLNAGNGEDTMWLFCCFDFFLLINNLFFLWSMFSLKTGIICSGTWTHIFAAVCWLVTINPLDIRWLCSIKLAHTESEAKSFCTHLQRCIEESGWLISVVSLTLLVQWSAYA